MSDNWIYDEDAFDEEFGDDDDDDEMEEEDEFEEDDEEEIESEMPPLLERISMMQNFAKAIGASQEQLDGLESFRKFQESKKQRS